MDKREEILDQIFEALKERPFDFSGTPLNKNPDFVKDAKYFYGVLSDSELVDNIPGAFGDEWHYHFSLSDFGHRELRGILHSEYLNRLEDERVNAEHIAQLDLRIKQLTEGNLELQNENLELQNKVIRERWKFLIIGFLIAAIINVIISWQVISWIVSKECPK